MRAKGDIRRTYLLPYLHIPWSRVLLEKLTGSQSVKKFPAIYGTRRFITSFTSARHLSLPWSQLDPVNTATCHFLKIYLNIIIPSTPGSPKWSLSPPKPYIYLCSPTYALHAQPTSFYHPNIIGSAVQIIKLLENRRTRTWNCTEWRGLDSNPGSPSREALIWTTSSSNSSLC